jgi:hypothetical protein
MSFPPLFQPFHEVDVVEVFGVGWFETDHWTSGLSLRPAILRPTFSAGVSEVSRFSCMKVLGVSRVFDYAGQKNLEGARPRWRLLWILLPGLPTIHTGMGCLESKPDGLNAMKRQVWVVHRGSSGCIHDDRVSCRRGNVSPRCGQRLASGIPISPRCAGSNK